MAENLITVEDIDALLRFLPLFQDPSTEYISGIGGGHITESGAIAMRYPRYTQPVLEFFWLAGQPCWADHAYDPQAAHAMLSDGASIRTASLSEIRTMLTYCVRGERFGDGFWLGVLRSGRIVALLRRLQALREDVAQRAQDQEA